jgi:hypothetical protein
MRSMSGRRSLIMMSSGCDKCLILSCAVRCRVVKRTPGIAQEARIDWNEKVADQKRYR